MSSIQVCPLCNTFHTGQYGKYCPNCANIRPNDITKREAKWHCNMCGRPMVSFGTCLICQNLYPFGKKI